ncbi:MAG: hypothetical protein SFV15_19600 [Polyangiaceae bacterium]|nr:hypothetical protein [Polyangiaceae bacterium]
MVEAEIGFAHRAAGAYSHRMVFQVARNFRRSALGAAALAVTNCGGVSESDANKFGPSPPASTSAIPTGSAVPTASAIPTMSAAPTMNPPPVSPATILLEDWETTAILRWQPYTPRTSMMPAARLLGELLTPPREASRKALHIVDLQTSSGVEVLSHEHFSLPEDATLTFWARCGLSNAERLIFAVTGEVTDSYWMAQAQGIAWQGKELVVPPTWTQIRVPLRELRPLGAVRASSHYFPA